MKLEQMAMVAAAAAVMFWPQLQAAFQSIRQTSVPRTAPVPGGGRAQWVPAVLALQDDLVAAGHAKAAAMAGPLAVELLTGTTPTTGAKK